MLKTIRSVTLLMLMTGFVSGCSLLKKTLEPEACPSPVWPTINTMQDMETTKTETQVWYGKIITQQCILDGNPPRSCTSQ